MSLLRKEKCIRTLAPMKYTEIFMNECPRDTATPSAWMTGILPAQNQKLVRARGN